MLETSVSIPYLGLPLQCGIYVYVIRLEAATMYHTRTASAHSTACSHTAATASSLHLHRSPAEHSSRSLAAGSRSPSQSLPLADLAAELTSSWYSACLNPTLNETSATQASDGILETSGGRDDGHRAVHGGRQPTESANTCKHGILLKKENMTWSRSNVA